jgi:hypothetical protein
MKKKAKLSFPSGYPYALFAVGKGKKYKYVLAATEEQASRCQASAKARVFPVTVTDTIWTLGHKETNKLLSQFGATWMTKENHVFYKELSR